ncbi:DUF3102 domain-containing protein [Deinococcus sp. Arct2-2]|uniref:DUF3102 domain-containing protein n=1 Tax=Deinococcus sp. Arct2-2 TaxID=2568653 RepID=UPI0010A4CDEB|nr:DUF3102 domain-containing protein [Deinococcus sp. Arct2-2]THF70520.1 DUF3102 domain-containing protein [Deinococcus sp. Arct2-2]
MIRTELEPFEYAALAPDVREMVQEHTGEIRNLARRAAQDIVEIGERLTQVKSALEHGQFGYWVKSEFGWSYPAAARFMQVADSFKTLNLRDLQIAPSALYALASGTTPAPVREEIVQRAQAGEPITHKDVKARLVQHQQQYEPEPPVPVVALPVAAPIPAPPGPAPVKKPYKPLPVEFEPMELQDGSFIQVPKPPVLPMQRELQEKDYGKAASRFDNVASKLSAALTAMDGYSMKEIQEIADSVEGRQLFAPVRVTRIRELLGELHRKWSASESKGQIIEAESLFDDPPRVGLKTLDALN